MATLLEPIYVVGPTAVGKSDVAVAIAERIGGEIVGADAFQIYEGLDLLTAKPEAALRARVLHHLIGEVPVTHAYDVAQFRVAAMRRIDEIVARGRVPVVVGGTGLYVRSLTHGLADLPESDLALREQLSSQPLDQLLARLDELDPVAGGAVDRNNPRRVIRAVEVCLLSGRPFSSFREQWDAPTAARGVVLLRDRDELRARIDQRTRQMFAAGVIDEVRGVKAIGPTAAQAIGFHRIRALLAGEIDEATCIASIQQDTRQYAKRQMTWFRRERHFQEIVREAEETDEVVAERAIRAIR